MNTRMGRNAARFAWLGAAALAVGSLFAGGAQAASVDMALTTVGKLEASLRPQGVPSDYVVTPNGFFAAACVQTVHQGEKLRSNGLIERADGSSRKAAACTQPHFTLAGARIEADGTVSPLANARAAKPAINGWVLDTNYSSSKAIGRIVADWTVPSAPQNKGDQVIYFFPGLEQLPNVQSILQPVLGWNGYGDKAWTLASWNCCVDGTTFHSDPINVAAGDQVRGDTKSTCAAGVNCDTWAIISEDLTKKTSTTLNTNPYDTLTWVFGGVLEAYGVSSCNQYPASGSIHYTNIKVYDLNQVQVASPPWTNDNPVGTQSPQCNYAASHTSGTATLVY